MTKITHTKDKNSIRIYMNGLLFFTLLVDCECYALLSYIAPDANIFYIKIFCKNNEPIIMELRTRERWEAVLKILDKEII